MVLIDNAVAAHTEKLQLEMIADAVLPDEASTADIAELLLSVPFPPDTWSSWSQVARQIKAAIVEEAVGEMCLDMDSD